MANGERCIHCGYQETEHELAVKGACQDFESEIKHDAHCPILGCNGDCAETIAKQEWEAKVAENQSRNCWGMGPRGQLYFVDIGS